MPPLFKKLISTHVAKVAVLLAAALGLATSVIVIAAPAASAYDRTDSIRNWETGRCLGRLIGGQNNYVIIGTHPAESACASGWRLRGPIASSDGHDVMLISIWDGWENRDMCLRRGGQKPGGTYVNTTYCDEGAVSQHWEVAGDPLNVMQLKPPYWSNGDHGQCLDSNRAGDVYMLNCNGGGFQNWKHGW